MGGGRGGVFICSCLDFRNKKNVNMIIPGLPAGCGENNSRLLLFAVDSFATIVLCFFLGRPALFGLVKSLSSRTIISGEAGS